VLGTATGSFIYYDADVWGGSGGTGIYPAVDVGRGTEWTIAFDSTQRYIGFWWSAGNPENYLQLLNEDGDVLLSPAFSTEGVVNAVLDGNSCGTLGSYGDLTYPPETTSGTWERYCGNPNDRFRDGGSDAYFAPEPYAFVHLRFEPGFRKLRFYGFNFEVDNVTVSRTLPGVSANETTTEVFNPFTISTPSVVIADPQSNLVSFPGLSLSDGDGEDNAMICFSQVEIGGAILSGQPFFSATGSGANITPETETNLQTFMGARDAVVTFSSTIDFAPVAAGQRFGIVGSRYFRLTATPQSNIGSTACSTASDNSVSTVVELRFLSSNRTNSFDIPID
jgi:hypothetical protein